MLEWPEHGMKAGDYGQENLWKTINKNEVNGKVSDFLWRKMIFRDFAWEKIKKYDRVALFAWNVLGKYIKRD